MLTKTSRNSAVSLGGGADNLNESQISNHSSKKPTELPDKFVNQKIARDARTAGQ